MKKETTAEAECVASNDGLWRNISSAPRDGAEFQAWVVTDEPGVGFWEPRCKFNEHGQIGMWGRVDYDEDGWDYGLNHLTATHWMPQPTEP